MRQAIVIGTGGHSRVILSILKECRNHDIIGLLDLNKPNNEESIMDVPVIGSASSLDEYQDSSSLDLFLAIGNNKIRSEWWKKISKMGLKIPNLISPHAVIDSTAEIGVSNVICANAFIGPDAVLQNNNLVNTGAVIEHEVSVGSNCHFAPSSTVAGRTVIKDNCFVGAGATVIDSITVESEVTIGAGSTVIGNIFEKNSTYVGTPAKKIK